MSQQDYWTPSLFPKQQIVFNTGTQQDAGDVHPEAAACMLVSGPRETGKTWCIGHRVARHLWETPGARVAVVCKVTRNATDGGVLCDLTDIVFPEWIESGIGFEYTTTDGNGIPGPKTDGRTRSIFLKVRNCYGGESELRILAVEHDCEIDQKLRGSRWSMIWLNELRNFQDKKILTTSYMQLRMPHLHRWQHLWIADTNPAPDGPANWIYKFWFLREPPEYDKRSVEDKEDIELGIERMRKASRLLEIFMEDNLRLTKEEIQVRKGLFIGDPGEYDRDILGLWTAGYGAGNKHFADLFSREIHLIEEDPENGESISLAADTSELLSGFDLGSSVNHGWAALEKRVVRISDKEWPVWTCLREFESVGERLPLSEIGQLVLAEIEGLSVLYKRPLGWRHWTDDSAMNVFRPTGAGFDYLEILSATNGKIAMQGVHKPNGSVVARARLLRRLLKEKRFYVSSKCPRVIEMLEQASKGSRASEFMAGDYKHIFDALTYPIFMESASELEEVAFKPTTGNRELISIM